VTTPTTPPDQQPTTQALHGHTRFEGAEHVSLYRVTASSLTGTEPGSLLIDRGDDTPRAWATYDATTGRVGPGFTGVRVGRVCPPCFLMGHGGRLGHDGDHGPDVPTVQPDDTSAVVDQTSGQDALIRSIAEAMWNVSQGYTVEDVAAVGGGDWSQDNANDVADQAMFMGHARRVLDHLTAAGWSNVTGIAPPPLTDDQVVLRVTLVPALARHQLKTPDETSAEG
jgi:hypothetical protein